MFLIALLFSGCSDVSTNLKDMSIVEGMGIDLSDGGICVTAQTLNLSKEGSGAEALSGNITMLTQGKGSDVSSAVSNARESLSKEFFFGQNRLIVFGMDIARDYIEKNLDYLIRSVDSRMDVSVCIAEKTAGEIMQSKENDVLVPSESVAALLKLGEKSGFGADITTAELLNLYLDKTSDIYLPVVKGGEKSVSVSGIAVFNDTSLAKVMDSESTYGFLLFTDDISSGNLEIKSKNMGVVGIKIISSHAKSRASVENGKLVLHTRIKAELMLDAVENGLIRTLTKERIDELESLAALKIKGMCNSAFLDCVEARSDCLRIGEMLAMSSPSDYAKLSDDWDKALSSALLDLEVDCRLKKINENSKGY